MGNGHNWLGIAELTVAIVSVILAIVFYRQSKRKIQLSYVVQQTQLLGASRGVLPEEVSILYQGNQISNLVKANYIIFNSGNEAIRHQDIVEGFPLAVTFSDTVFLLKASILKTSLPQNDVVIKPPTESEDTIEIDFSYLEPRHGFNIEFLYSGEIYEPAISGTIIGMPNGFRRFNPVAQQNLTGAIVSFFGFIFGIIPATVFYLEGRHFIDFIGISDQSPAVGAMFILFVGVGVIGGFLIGILISRSLFRRVGLPPELNT